MPAAAKAACSRASTRACARVERDVLRVGERRAPRRLLTGTVWSPCCATALVLHAARHLLAARAGVGIGVGGRADVGVAWQGALGAWRGAHVRRGLELVEVWPSPSVSYLAMSTEMRSESTSVKSRRSRRGSTYRPSGRRPGTSARGNARVMAQAPGWPPERGGSRDSNPSPAPAPAPAQPSPAAARTSRSGRCAGSRPPGRRHPSTAPGSCARSGTPEASRGTNWCAAPRRGEGGGRFGGEGAGSNPN